MTRRNRLELELTDAERIEAVTTNLRGLAYALTQMTARMAELREAQVAAPIAVAVQRDMWAAVAELAVQSAEHSFALFREHEHEIPPGFR